MRNFIAINEIVIPDRMRKQVRDIESLADSIRELGLIQPIGIVPETKTLVCGFRRLCACKHLGMERIDYVDQKDLPEDEREEMEFAENHERDDFTWQEEALGILRIYRKKRARGIQEGWAWGLTQACDAFGMALGTINYYLKVGKRLEEELSLPVEKRRIWNFANASEAYRLGILAEDEDTKNLILAQQMKQRATTQTQREEDHKVVAHVQAVQASPDALQAERERYYSNPLNKIPFEEYWTEKVKESEALKNTVYLSNRLLHVDCIGYMNRVENVGVFDHIITDPPYAIDIENLDQQNQSGGMRDLDKLKDAHQVEENLVLLEKFFPAAWKCTKPNAFVIVFADMSVWNQLETWANKAGFATQSWAGIWEKVNQSVMNNCASYNTTKDYEIVLFCRKPGTTLLKKRNSSIFRGSNVEATKLTGHPFAKPFEVTRELVDMVSLPGQTILEPFAGGGSIAMETLKQQRNVVACEKEEYWYNMLLTNVKNFYLKTNPKFVFK